MFDPNIYPKFNVTDSSFEVLIPETTNNKVYLTNITCFKNGDTYLNDKTILNFNTQEDKEIAFDFINDFIGITNAQKVRTFAQESSGDLPNQPKQLNLNEVKFICEMVISELAELCQTVLDDNKVLEFLHSCIGKDFKPNTLQDKCTQQELISLQSDALVDAIYYIYHTAAKKGINIDKIFNVVHKANMKKKFPDGTFHKRDDGKIIKPENWQEPNVTDEIKDQENNGSFEKNDQFFNILI